MKLPYLRRIHKAGIGVVGVVFVAGAAIGLSGASSKPHTVKLSDSTTTSAAPVTGASNGPAPGAGAAASPADQSSSSPASTSGGAGTGSAGGSTAPDPPAAPTLVSTKTCYTKTPAPSGLIIATPYAVSVYSDGSYQTAPQAVLGMNPKVPLEYTPASINGVTYYCAPN